MLADGLEKTHHVSPLMGMDQTYTFRAKAFDATLSLRRRELARYPAMWLLKGARCYPHPEGAEVAR